MSICKYANLFVCVKLYICKYVYCAHVDMYQGIYSMYIYVNTCICKNVHINVPVVPHKAVAEVSRIGNV